MLKNASKAALKSQSGSMNMQIKAFLKNDPSALHLGDIGSIFGGGHENQIAQSVKKLGSLSKYVGGGDSSTMASSILYAPQSKLPSTQGGYLVNKPSTVRFNTSPSKFKFPDT